MYPEVGDNNWGRPTQDDTQADSLSSPARLRRSPNQILNAHWTHLKEEIVQKVFLATSNAYLLPFLVPEHLQVPQAAVKLPRLNR